LVILAAPAESHADFYKVLSADGGPPLAAEDGIDVGAAIVTWQAALPGLRGADVLHRALAVVETMVMSGTTRRLCQRRRGGQHKGSLLRLGRLDAMETASLLELAGHLSLAEAWAACTYGARRAMGPAAR
jgi:hypothetical protein